MARIYDNIETKFAEGLQGIITNVGVKRVDFCVGYFNLRGCTPSYTLPIVLMTIHLLNGTKNE